MIAFVRGNFVNKTPTSVTVDVNGVGYELLISLNTYSRIQNLEKGSLFTYLQIKEDGHTLYGFFEVQEKDLFTQLISVSGVGAATARMILSSMKSEDVVRAIATRDARVLECVKGIGKKSAERIILELKDKMGKISYRFKYFSIDKQFFGTGCVKCSDRVGHSAKHRRTGCK